MASRQCCIKDAIMSGAGIQHRLRHAASAVGLVATGIVAMAQPAAAGPYADAILANNPYAYYRLNETGGTTVQDASGNGRNGTFVNAPALNQAGALAEPGNSAVRFTASSGQYVNIPLAFGGAGWSQVTVEAWINIAAATSDFQAIVSSTGLDFVHFQAYVAGQNVVYATPNNANLPIISQSLAGWHHVVMTAKSGEQALYIDGTLAGSASATFTNLTGASSLRIGSGYSNRFFNGLIDEVAIYSTALTEAQIDTHYAAASDVGVPEPAALGLLATGITGLATLRRRRLPSA
jgi:hypothetical protein